MPSAISKTAAASSGLVLTMPLRSPPAKKVFLALATTTPVTDDSSAASSSYRRSIAASIEDR